MSAAILLLLVVFALGLVVLYRSLWPARQGDTPHCPKCDYNLTGAAGRVCPECGRTWGEQTLVRGERHRRPRLVTIGLILVLPALLLFGGTAAQMILGMDVNRIKPTAMLLWEVSADDWPGSQPAIDEIARRIGRGRLSAGRLDRFFRKVVKVELLARPTMIHSDGVGRWQTTIRAAKVPGVCVQVVACEQRFAGGRSTDNYPIGSGMYWSLSYVPEGRPLYNSHHVVRLDVGQQSVAQRWHLQYWWDPNGMGGAPGPGAKAVCRQTVDAQAAFEVLQEAPADYIRIVSGPDPETFLKPFIRPGQIRIAPRSLLTNPSKPVPYLAATLESTLADLALPAIWEVLLRTGGREYRIGSLRAEVGSNAYQMEAAYDGPLVDRADLVLRPSPEDARQTVDLFEIWDCELVYKDVPIHVEDQVRAAASSQRAAQSQAAAE